MDNFQQKFVEEATDLINNLEESLLTLEKQKDDKELIAAVFRIMHSLKGGGGMFGFEAISNFTHNLETIYDEVRNDKLSITDELLSISFSSVDHLRNLLNPDALEDDQIKKNNEILLGKVEQILSGINTKSDNNTLQKQVDTKESDETCYLIRFVPNQDIMDNGTNPLYLVDELCDLGTGLVFPQINNIPTFDNNFIANKCYIWWDIILSTSQSIELIKEVFIFVEDDSSIEIIELSNHNILQDANTIEKIQEKYEEESGQISVEALRQLIKELDDAKKNTKISVREKLNIFTKENIISSIRVDSEKIDQLMNLVSELVTTQASLSLYVEENQIYELNQLSENIENITRQLRDTAFSISLIPIETMLTRFHRLIRDLSAEFSKNIEFITEGAETELDKTLVQGLTDPLMHIIRNSVDHGIEPESERIAKGKTPQGMIYLKAYYSGAHVVIKIQDDGNGINIEKVRKKAIEKDFITLDTQLSDREMLDLIFLPGFSTAENVTDISGRGVGMDVVKKKIDEIRGTVEVETKKGVGTTTTIKLPLTLSIIDGLLVRIDDTKYVMPLNLVDKIYAFKHQEFVDSYNNLITVESEQVPFYNLREEFSVKSDAPETEQLVMVKYEDKRVGLVVDNVIGEYQAVLKPLGKLYINHDIISGATILGDGTIALVLDTNKIINEFSFKN